MKSYVTFDTSLPIFFAKLEQVIGNLVLSDGIFLRETTGQLSLILENYEISLSSKDDVSIRNVMGNYVRPGEKFIFRASEIFTDFQDLISSATLQRVHLDNDARFAFVQVVDRRAVGGDWLISPRPRNEGPARVAFCSLKGGVGRSTALCVLAAHLASTGKRVLCVDMDLEAPGLGNMLLNPDTLPRFGLLDYVVESGLGPLDKSFLLEILSPSWLAAGRGRIDVVPAIGRASLQHPANVVAKIARAYSSTSAEVSGWTDFSVRVQELLDLLTSDSSYDIIFVDARAGLHETAATALLGLGAEILLFGSNTPQTYTGFDLLFSSLFQNAGASEDFLSRFCVVQSKSYDGRVSDEFSSNIRVLVENQLRVANEYVPDLESLERDFATEWSDDAGGDMSLTDDLVAVEAVSEDANYRYFDPVENPKLLDRASYHESFAALIAYVEALTTVIEDGT